MIRSKGCRLVCFGAQLIKASQAFALVRQQTPRKAADERSAHHLNTASIVRVMT